MAKHEHGEQAVQATSDALSSAFAKAMARIEEMKGKSGRTLVDQISDEDWAALDATKEKALIRDPSGLDEYDALYEDDLKPQAA